MRLRIDLAYDGGAFHGWAAQPELRTVQGELEAALATVLRLPEVSTVCAGRTDTGVHARGQVVHLDIADDLGAAVLGERLVGVAEILDIAARQDGAAEHGRLQRILPALGKQRAADEGDFGEA